MCENLDKYIKKEDFDCIGQVARHCDLDKLCIATEEAKIFDVIELFCFDFVDDVLNNWNSEEDEYKLLICGGKYTDKQGHNHYLLGFKKLWVYYSYSRYLLINQLNDTANGNVEKRNDFSLPTPLKEITDFSNKYRKMGLEVYKNLLEYLKENSEKYPHFGNCKNCGECGSEENHTGGKTKKMTGFSFTTITK